MDKMVRMEPLVDHLLAVMEMAALEEALEAMEEMALDLEVAMEDKEVVEAVALEGVAEEGVVAAAVVADDICECANHLFVMS